MQGQPLQGDHADGVVDLAVLQHVRTSAKGRTLTRMFSPSERQAEDATALVASTRPRKIVQASEQAPGVSMMSCR